MYLAAVHTNHAHVVQRLYLDCLNNIDGVFPRKFPRKQPNTHCTCRQAKGFTLAPPAPPKLHLKLNMELFKETNPYNTVKQPAKAATPEGLVYRIA